MAVAVKRWRITSSVRGSPVALKIGVEHLKGFLLADVRCPDGCTIWYCHCLLTDHHVSVASTALSSASVISGCSTTNCRIRSSCAARAYRLYPPNWAGLIMPVRGAAYESVPQGADTHTEFAVSGIVAQSCSALTTHAAGAPNTAFPSHAGPRPARILNPIRIPMGIPEDSVFSGNALRWPRRSASAGRASIGCSKPPGAREELANSPAQR